ncbi:MAG: hypothetical protein ACP5HS_05455, partial [Anaerolineae bacterium]
KRRKRRDLAPRTRPSKAPPHTLRAGKVSGLGMAFARYKNGQSYVAVVVDLTVLLNRPGAPHLGVGEGIHGPVPAAIANAIFDAVGVRLQQIPFTPDLVRAALRAT